MIFSLRPKKNYYVPYTRSQHRSNRKCVQCNLMMILAKEKLCASLFKNNVMKTFVTNRIPNIRRFCPHLNMCFLFENTSISMWFFGSSTLYNNENDSFYRKLNDLKTLFKVEIFENEGPSVSAWTSENEDFWKA